MGTITSEVRKVLRKALWFVAKTYIAAWAWPKFKRNTSAFIRRTFSVRNLLGDGAGTWWEMRKVK
ncbi:MAG: hypothetical protein ACOYU7_03745 [Bacillota bacterium]|jgi:hypothetical protein|uniref:hypothetical protein n=1 Tax=unclassified Candidatus Desulforudis TaxID=2635950 RepID=UPI00347FD653